MKMILINDTDHGDDNNEITMVMMMMVIMAMTLVMTAINEDE